MFVEMPIKTELESQTQDQGIIMSESMSMGMVESSDPNENKQNELVSYILEEFNKARDKRQPDEHRWLDCYRNYRGFYSAHTQFSDSEKSRAFIKITKTKVQAAYAQVVDVLFAGNRFPIGVQPANIALTVEDAVHFDPQAPEEEAPAPTSQMAPHIAKLFGPTKNLLSKVKDKLKSGVGTTPTSATYEPAKAAATKMEKKIHDQLDEAGASKALRSLVAEMCLFGMGILKGPFAIDKEYPKWDVDGTYTPVSKTIPLVEFVSIWDAYPDADARNMAEAEKFIQRHRLSRTQLRGLKKRPMFRGKNIEKVIDNGPNYVLQSWESELSDASDATTTDRWEVLEFWGIVDKEIAKRTGLKIPKEYKDFDEIQVNAWICDDQVLRLVLNPFKPSRIPYHAVPYELNPYSFFGIGVAENMSDSQLLMNGFMRMAVDNAALSGNVVFEVNEDLLAPGQSMDVFPGKVFRRSGGQPGQAINSININSTSQDVLMLFDKARQLSDESTGMPSYAHGMTGVMSTGKTAAGMSMLMGAAAQNIKAVVRNLDDYLLSPLGKDLFAFNMQFNFDADYIGDAVVVAKGTESLMRNEVRSQKLLQLAQFAAGNPSMAPLIKWDYILREFAASMDLDEENVANDPRAAIDQAQEMAARSAIMAPPGDPAQAQAAQAAQAQGNGQVPGASIPQPQDPTQNGNGAIGPGAAPEPGAEGFSGQQPQAA